jgi:hypothetical protein
MVTVPQGTQNPAYVRSRPTFCIPESRKCGPLIAVSGFADLNNTVGGTLDKSNSWHSKLTADFLFPHQNSLAFSWGGPASARRKMVRSQAAKS